jgi:hypothetical protein
MRRLTISVSDEVAAKAQRAVDAGDANSVSGYFGQLAEREPDWVAARKVVDSMLTEAGPVSDDDRAWARSVIGMGGSAASGAA